MSVTQGSRSTSPEFNQTHTINSALENFEKSEEQKVHMKDKNNMERGRERRLMVL